jgi:hypothetical protein
MENFEFDQIYSSPRIFPMSQVAQEMELAYGMAIWQQVDIRVR